MTCMRLQKRVFYAQAWSLIVRHAPLFAERIEAWAYGPVVYELFQAHKGRFTVGQLPAGDVNKIPEELRTFLKNVLAHYSWMNGAELSALVQSEKPWKEAYENAWLNEKYPNEIKQEAMREFYTLQLRPPWDCFLK